MTLRVWVGDRAQRHLRLGGAAMALPAALLAAQPAAAQDLTHRFINPSFGGNPFYSDHLLAIANIHRPAEPEEPAATPPSEEELLARQLRSQFLAQLSGEIRSRILAAQPGQSGDFDLGDQRISFVRTATETRITFVNSRTGETDSLVIPVSSSTSPFPGAFAAGTTSLAATGERALSGGSLSIAPGLSPAPLGTTGTGAVSGLLGSRSLELPLTGR